MSDSTKWTILLVLLTAITCSNVLNCCGHRKGFANNMFAYRAPAAYRGTGRVSYASLIPVSYITDTANPLTWETLAQVSFAVKFNQQYKMNFQYPVFDPRLKALEGKEYTIAGYIIPLDVKEGLYAISRNPYSACYFCGKAGPESVVSLKFRKKPGRIWLDKYKTMRGTLRLNDTDPNDFIYIFTGTEECKTPDSDY